MLPGFRLVCATVVLAISFVVFGLGAAALLRASHDQFASLPSAQAPREPLLAREGEMRQATLALLRVEMMAEQAEAPRVSVDAADSETAVAVAAPSDATAPEPAAVVRGDEAAAHIEPAASDPPPIAPRGAIGEAADLPPPEQAARPDARVVAMADDKPASVAASPDGTACIPAANPQPGQPLAVLVDQVLPRADAATPVDAGKSAIDRAHQARIRARHRQAMLRRHRLLLQAKARAAALALQQQQANPFFGFATTRTRQSTPRT